MISFTNTDILHMLRETMERISAAMNPLRLEIGYNYHTDGSKIKDFVIFHVMFDNNESFEECVAEWTLSGGEPIPSKIPVQVRLDNLEPSDAQKVMKILKCEPEKQYAYDDEPDEKYRYAVADIKEFICRNIDNALRELMDNNRLPDWQKKRAIAVINNAKEEDWSQDGVISEVGNTAAGQNKLGRLARRREYQALVAKKKGEKGKKIDYLNRSFDAQNKAHDEREKYNDYPSRHWLSGAYYKGLDNKAI